MLCALFDYFGLDITEGTPDVVKPRVRAAGFSVTGARSVLFISVASFLLLRHNFVMHKVVAAITTNPSKLVNTAVAPRTLSSQLLVP